MRDGGSASRWDGQVSAQRQRCFEMSTMYFTPASCARRTQASGNSRKGLDLLGGGGANEQGFEPGGRLAVVEFAQVEERLLAGVLGRKGGCVSTTSTGRRFRR